jgi:hypothetical protein
MANPMVDKLKNAGLQHGEKVVEVDGATGCREESPWRCCHALLLS